MKILTINNLYPPHIIGGYEINCRDTMESLAKKGHQITVLCSDYQAPKITDISPSDKIIRRLKVHGMYGHPWLSMPKLYEQEKHNHQVLRETMAAVKPDIIFIWNMGGISKSLLHDIERSSIPCAFFVSDHWIARSLKADVWLQWWNVPGKVSRNIPRTLLTLLGIRSILDANAPTYSWDLLRFPNLYFCSDYMKQQTQEQGWPVSHAKIIYNGVRSREFTKKTDYSTFGKLLWVGRINDDKDPFTAVRALKLIHDRGLTEVTLDLYGKGTPEDEKRLHDLISELGLQQSVKCSSASPSEMHGLYAQYDALLFTPNWGEPFAVTPLEGAAAGLPVISTLDGGQREIVKDRVNAIAADAGSAASFADGIELLAHDPELRRTLGAEALREVEAEFEDEKRFDKVEAFLLNVIAQGR